jgi:hypothetical protein
VTRVPTTRIPLSLEVREHAIRRAIDAFVRQYPDCAAWDAEPCPCGCSTWLRTTCPDFDPVVVVVDPRTFEATTIVVRGDAA